MRTLQISKIALEIANRLSLRHHKQIAYRLIVQNDFLMIAGFCVEPNRFQLDSFSVRYFIQPLYIKFDYLDLSLGDVVGEWNITNITATLSPSPCLAYRKKSRCFYIYVKLFS